MKTKYTVLPLLIVAATLGFGTGCVVHAHGPGGGATVAVGGEVDVPEPPPPEEVDTMGVQPGPQYVWIAGGWNWTGQWIWEPGHWAVPPRPGATWVPHHYEYRDGRHVFIRGGWR